MTSSKSHRKFIDILQGCEGGALPAFWSYAANNQFASIANYPYTAKDGTCQNVPLTPVTAVSNVVTCQQVGSDTSMIDALMSGPVVVGVEVGGTFQGYSGGEYLHFFSDRRNNSESPRRVQRCRWSGRPRIFESRSCSGGVWNKP